MSGKRVHNSRVIFIEDIWDRRHPLRFLLDPRIHHHHLMLSGTHQSSVHRFYLNNMSLGKRISSKFRETHLEHSTEIWTLPRRSCIGRLKLEITSTYSKSQSRRILSRFFIWTIAELPIQSCNLGSHIHGFWLTNDARSILATVRCEYQSCRWVRLQPDLILPCLCTRKVRLGVGILTCHTIERRMLDVWFQIAP